MSRQQLALLPSLYVYCSKCPLFLYTASPNPPVITTINSFYTSISLYWTHDKTCFENVTVKFHVQLNTGTQPVVTDQLMAEIGGIISGRNYTISVMAVVDDTQRSEPDRENLRAGGYRKDCSDYFCSEIHTKTQSVQWWKWL